MTVFRKVSSVVLPVIVAGGFIGLSLTGTDKTKQEDEAEYRQIVKSTLDNAPVVLQQQAVRAIQVEAEKRHEEFVRQDKIRMAKIQAKIDAEVARIKEQDRQRELAKQRAIAEEKRKNEIARQARIAEQQRQQQQSNGKQQSTQQPQQHQQVSRGNSEAKSGWINFRGTYYGADCNGCSGLTATGIDVRGTIYSHGLRIIAVDPSIIRLGSIVEVQTPNETFRAIAGDTGGGIKGYHIDILVESESRASQIGTHTVQVRVLKDPK